MILEAWAAGLPVVISDRTPWRDLESQGVGWDLPLDNPQRWIEVLDHLIRLPPEALLELKHKCFAHYQSIASNPPLDDYRKLFSIACQ